LISPGFVSEYVKYHALQSTDISVAPSALESLCIAALESWQHGSPLLVNGLSAVLVGHCVRSNGGLWYTNYLEFHEALKQLLSDASLRTLLGRQGRKYVLDNYRWAAVERTYREVIDEIVRAGAAHAGTSVADKAAPLIR
jgi:glycosyltransferase involved in cell wall biosynthesis